MQPLTAAAAGAVEPLTVTRPYEVARMMTAFNVMQH
jgi:hypothetical protein